MNTNKTLRFDQVIIKNTLVKKVFISLISLFLCTLVFFLANSILNAFRINYFAFNKNIEVVLERSKVISVKAEEFSQTKALAELGTNRLNGVFYRFDDNLMNARCPTIKIDKIESNRQIKDICFEFSSIEDLPIKPEKEFLIIENSILKYKHDPTNVLQSFKNLNIYKETIGEIEIRIKLKNAKKITIGWSKNTSTTFNSHQVYYLGIPTIPDNRFHTYTVNAQTAFKGFLNSTVPIRKLFIYPVGVSDDEVEIDYLRFISKRTKYAKKPFGVVYETINHELRKAIYMHSSFDLTYLIDMPEGKSFLKFGMGILENNDPVQFKIIIKTDDKTETLFSKKISSSDTWYNSVIDLSLYGGKEVELIFKTKGSKKNIAYWSNPLIHTPPRQRFNIVIVLEDALRADHVSCYNYIQKTTPVKDKLAEKGVVFLNAFSQATHTRASCPSFMTSLYPSATGVWNESDMLNNRYLTLAEILRSQGYATASFIQNTHAGPNAGLHQGFSTIFDFEKLGQRAGGIYGGSYLNKWLKANTDRNFFLYLHLIDPHGPYAPPEEFIARYKKPFIGGKKKVAKNKSLDPDWLKVPTVESRIFLYDEEIKYNDFYFNLFLKTLNELKLLKDTMIIFISDHGEHLGEHLMGDHLQWDHVPPGYIQVLHIPLIMVYPKRLPTGIKIKQPVQLIDIMPTILDIANIKTDNLLIQGDSLLSLMSGKELSFWSNRFCISEEVRLKSKDALNAYGSIFYRNLHILNSEDIYSPLSNKMKKINKKLYEVFFTPRVFNMPADKSEQNALINFLIDPAFKSKIRNFMNNRRNINLKTWKTLTKGNEQIIKYDPAAVEQLRSLGYIK